MTDGKGPDSPSACFYMETVLLLTEPVLLTDIYIIFMLFRSNYGSVKISEYLAGFQIKAGGGKMEIYLIQHAESKSKEEDPERPLTDKGRNDTEKVASYARNHADIDIKIIFHSGKLRAIQTAEILAKFINPSEGFRESDGLEPMADPDIWAERISTSKGNIMLVGHLPHLGKLAGVLLNADESKNVVNFQNSGMVKLVQAEDGIWMMYWMIVPSIV
jgi:phosphohistidine phosphatase